MKPPRKINPRIAFRLKQRELVQNSPSIAEKFPQLSALTLQLMFYDADGITRHEEMKCKLNLQHAKSMLCYACFHRECVGGDFDLSQALAAVVVGRRKVLIGEMRCQGKRKRGEGAPMPCHSLLRYKLTLGYD